VDGQVYDEEFGIGYWEFGGKSYSIECTG